MLRALVAHPSATLRALLVRALEREGVEVAAQAATLAEAQAATGPVQLLIADRDLAPSGWDWLAQLRSRACPDGQVWVTGGFVTRAEAEALRDAGVAAFLLTPLEAGRLGTRVRRLVAASHAQAGPGLPRAA